MYDYIEIRDGGDENSLKLGAFCGYKVSVIEFWYNIITDQNLQTFDYMMLSLWVKICLVSDARRYKIYRESVVDKIRLWWISAEGWFRSLIYEGWANKYIKLVHILSQQSI